ncbi:MAG: hypothetical protein RLZZ598_1521 [Pseudomonadota bacterium]
MAMFRHKTEARPAWPSSDPLRLDAASSSSSRDNGFDSSWELRRGLEVAELDELPEDFVMPGDHPPRFTRKPSR